jgi:hypothetical protein
MKQENGTSIFGQCEISHPVVRGPTIAISPSLDLALDAEDADDHTGGIISAAGNVYFEQSGKGAEIPPLPSRIKRGWPFCSCIRETHLITKYAHNRRVLHQCIRPGDPPST